MKRYALWALLAALLLTTPVAAHHVPVPLAESDADALAIFVYEMQAQNDALLETHRAVNAAGSTLEKSGLIDEMRAGIETTLAHIDALDVRECFTDLADLADDFFEAIASAYAVSTTPTEKTGHLAQAGAVGQLIDTAALRALIDCAPQEG